MQRKCILNIHTPKYRDVFREEMNSHEDYAFRHGYRYVSVGLGQEDAGLAKWRKLEILLELLENNDAVLLLDVDCLVRKDAPDICREVVDGKYVYMTRGHSGRWNSGVIFALSAESSQSFFREVLATRNEAIRLENFVSAEGENGHVIQAAQDPRFSSIIQELDYVWNNNRFPGKMDYIRHYGGGPMREFWKQQRASRSPGRMALAGARQMADRLARVVRWVRPK